MKLYEVGNRIVNCFIYKIDEGYVMIDTGYDNYLEKNIKRMNKYNINPNDIKYIFLTHAHDDHAGFLNEFMNKYKDVKVICSDKSISVLRQGQNPRDGGCSTKFALIFCNIMKIFGRGKHLFPKIDKENESRIIEITDKNKKELESTLQSKIIYTPGHTSDSISLLHNSGNLFCGDACMNGLPSIKKITIWVENKQEFIDSWKKIIELKPKIIYPGHGKKFNYHKLEKNLKYLENIKLHRLKF